MDLGYWQQWSTWDEWSEFAPPRWDHLYRADSEMLHEFAACSIDRAVEYCQPMPWALGVDDDAGELLASVAHARTPRRVAGLAAVSIMHARTAYDLGDYADACRLAVYAVCLWERRDLDWLYAIAPVSWCAWIKSIVEDEITVQARAMSMSRGCET